MASSSCGFGRLTLSGTSDDTLCHHLTRAGILRPIGMVPKAIALRVVSMLWGMSFSISIYWSTGFSTTMASLQQEDFELSSTHLTLPSTKPRGILPSSYLTVPKPKARNRTSVVPEQTRPLQDCTNALISSEAKSASRSIFDISEPSQETLSILCSPEARESWPIPLSDRLYMSVYSSSSIDSELSEFSNPPARRYRTPNLHKMPRNISTVSPFWSLIYLR
jgi:hypothetical protein